MPEHDELIGVADIVQRLGVTRQRVHQLAKKPTFPAPEAVVAGRRIWRRSAVEQWIRANPRPRRPTSASSGS